MAFGNVDLATLEGLKGPDGYGTLHSKTTGVQYNGGHSIGEQRTLDEPGDYLTLFPPPPPLDDAANTGRAR